MSNETSTYLPWDLSDEASQVGDGGGEESGAEHSAGASLYPLLCCPPARFLPVTDDRTLICVNTSGCAAFMSLST